MTQAVPLSDAKARLAHLVQAAEAGQVVHISRHGKPVAVLAPVPKRPMDRWKQANPLTIPGLSLSQEVIADREESP